MIRAVSMAWMSVQLKGFSYQMTIGEVDRCRQAVLVTYSTPIRENSTFTGAIELDLHNALKFTLVTHSQPTKRMKSLVHVCR